VTKIGFWPLALQLYLPRVWQKDPERLKAAGVPERFRAGLSRPRQALAMLDEIMTEKLPITGLITSAAYETPEFLDGLEQKGLSCHVIAEGKDSEIEGVTNGKSRTKEPGTESRMRSRQIREFAETITRGHACMLEELGLAHFEGRSWRGFHHHAVFVMLACAFPLWNMAKGQKTETTDKFFETM
jgi:SRSO17 transposase